MAKTGTQKYVDFTFRHRHIHVLLDKVLIFRYLRRLHGRFWGLAGVIIMVTGFSICFLIRPELWHLSTAFSDFGDDIRTAPYFAGSVFFGAYGLWRWRNYLRRTLKRAMPVTGLVTLTIFGLYIVALMPQSWGEWPYRIHFVGFMLAGLSMLATVVFDGLLSHTRRGGNRRTWRLIRIVSFLSIIAGGVIALGSTKSWGWFALSLVGESLMLFGYALWIAFKTYQGEGGRTTLAKLLKNVVLVD